MLFVKSRKIKIFTLITFVIALAVAVTRTVLLTQIVEPSTGLYYAEAGWGYAFDIGVLLLLAVLIVTCRILFKKINSPAKLGNSSTAIVFSSVLCAFMYFSLFGYGLYCMLFSESGADLPLIIEALLCVPCGINHLFISANEKRKKTTVQGLLALSVPVFFAVRTIEVFMGTDTQINASQRSLELMMLCSVMLFYLFEASFIAKDDGESKTSLSNYYAAATATVSLVCVSVLPYLLVSVFWVFETDFVVMDALECCVMLYAACGVLTAGED